MKTIIAFLVGMMLVTGCGKEEEPVKKYKYYAENVENERVLSEEFFPLYEDEYIEEFGEGNYLIQYDYDPTFKRAKWVAIPRTEPTWYDDIEGF